MVVNDAIVMTCVDSTIGVDYLEDVESVLSSYTRMYVKEDIYLACVINEDDLPD